MEQEAKRGGREAREAVQMLRARVFCAYRHNYALPFGSNERVVDIETLSSRAESEKPFQGLRYTVVAAAWFVGNTSISAMLTWSGRPATKTTVSAMSFPSSGCRP